MAELARRFADKDFAKGEGQYEQRDMLDAYGKRLTTDIQLERPLKVVVDCGNGVGGAVAPKLLQAIGADLIPLYCDVDGAFPNHRPDPSSPDDLEDLRLCVRNFQAELGIAFDGDADRLALVTKNGEIVWPDRLLMLLADSVLSGRPGEAVVYDVRCSGHLQSIVEQAGGRGVMTASGQRAVARRLVEEEAPLGGEMNGHLIINDRWYPFDDALYAAARLLEVLAADARDLDEILAEQPVFKSSPEIVVNIDRERSQSLVERLSNESDFGDARVTRLDGIRADWSDRWGLARVNVDTGELVLRFGGDEANALGKVRSEFREKLLELDPKLPLPY
jgi:phosphomannomutase/phosphoglucomutase